MAQPELSKRHSSKLFAPMSVGLGSGLELLEACGVFLVGGKGGGQERRQGPSFLMARTWCSIGSFWATLAGDAGVRQQPGLFFLPSFRQIRSSISSWATTHTPTSLSLFSLHSHPAEAALRFHSAASTPTRTPTPAAPAPTSHPFPSRFPSMVTPPVEVSQRLLGYPLLAIETAHAARNAGKLLDSLQQADPPALHSRGLLPSMHPLVYFPFQPRWSFLPASRPR